MSTTQSVSKLKSALKSFNAYCTKRDCFPSISLEDKSFAIWTDYRNGFAMYAMDTTTGKLYTCVATYGGLEWKPNYFQYI